MTQRLFTSLRLRFLFAALVWVSIATVVAGFFIAGVYRAHLTQNFHDELDIHLVELLRLTDTNAAGNPVLNRPLSDPRFEDPGSGFYYQIERDGFTPVTSPTLNGKALEGRVAAEQKEKFAWVKGPDGEVLQCGITAPSRNGGPPLRFSIAVERRVLEQTLAGFNSDLFRSLSVFAALMVIGATLQIQFGLRPARLIADAIERLRQGKAERLPIDVPGEFNPIVTRLNALLDSQAALVQRARVETGNLAHGLRTPLALIGDEAEHLVNQGQAETARFIQEQCRRISRQIDYHTTRAGAAGMRVTGYMANIAELVRQIVNAMQRLHAGKSLTFVVDIPVTAVVNCDEGDLAEILSNLIDNACKWAASRIVVSARIADGRAVVEVRDDGPGIASEMRVQVFDVGARLDESKAGSGLGLAISRDLTRLYGGDLELEDAPGGGLLARLTLPEAGAL
jgi:signal transduction histidine kinase